MTGDLGDEQAGGGGEGVGGGMKQQGEGGINPEGLWGGGKREERGQQRARKKGGASMKERGVTRRGGGERRLEQQGSVSMHAISMHAREAYLVLRVTIVPPLLASFHHLLPAEAVVVLGGCRSCPLLHGFQIKVRLCPKSRLLTCTVYHDEYCYCCCDSCY